MLKLKSAAPLLGLLLLTASSFSWADDEKDQDGHKDRYDPTYSAIRLSSVSTDFSNIDRAFNLGFTLGIRIPGLKIQGTEFLSAEIDISSTLIPGENSGTGPLLGGGNNNGDDDGGLLGGLLGGGGGGDDGSNSGGSSSSASNDPDDLRLNAVGIFARARSPGKFFGSVRLGYRFVESTIDELEEDQTGSAWGIGGGYQYSERGGAVELNYTQYGSDLNFISLVVSY